MEDNTQAVQKTLVRKGNIVLNVGGIIHANLAAEFEQGGVGVQVTMTTCEGPLTLEYAGGDAADVTDIILSEAKDLNA